MRGMLRIAVVVGGIVLAGCSGGGGSGAATSPGGAASEPGGPRIVSTVPAATLNLVEIGAADRLVGVTRYDVLYLPAAQQGLPVVGDYETMDLERLVKLHPTAVVVQTAAARMSGRLRELAAAHQMEVVNIQLNTLDDLWRTVAVLGRISGRQAEAERAIWEAQGQLAEIRRETAAEKPVRVLYALSEDPVMIAGGKTFLDEMLTAAGGENVGASVGEGYPMVGSETLVKLNPEVLLVNLAGQPAEKANDPRLEKWYRLPMDAARNHRVHLVTEGNSVMASLDVGEQVRRLAAVLHGHDYPTSPATEAAR